MKEKKNDSSQVKFYKQDILESQLLRNKQDLLNAILEDDQMYTLKEVEKLLEENLNKEVH